MSVLQYSNSLLLPLKTTTLMSHPQRTDSSMAFFRSPFFRLVKVT